MDGINAWNIWVIKYPQTYIFASPLAKQNTKQNYSTKTRFNNLVANFSNSISEISANHDTNNQELIKSSKHHPIINQISFKQNIEKPCVS